MKRRDFFRYFVQIFLIGFVLENPIVNSSNSALKQGRVYWDGGNEVKMG
jgi:hypothetical protein